MRQKLTFLRHLLTLSNGCPVLAVGLLLPRFAWSTPRLNQLKLITLTVL